MSNQHCLDVVRRNKQKIIDFVLKYLRYKGVTHKEIFVFKSRVAGTCRPNSDIDIYVQLDEKHKAFIEKGGDKKIYHECGEDLKTLEIGLIDIVQGWPITLDIWMGILPHPPNSLKSKCEWKKWWMKLSEV